MGPYDSCRLIHMNFSSYIDKPFTKEASLNEELLYIHSYEAMRLADDLIDLELEAIDRIIDTVKDNENQTEYKLWNLIKDTTLQGRRAGLGFTALADTLAMLNLKYDSPEGIKKTEEIMRIFFKGQLDSQIDMAISRGAFPAWDRELEFPKDKDSNAWFKFLREEFPTEFARMKQYGRRNISWSTVAPTGTVSIMARTSSGIEPVFLPYYERKKKCMNASDRVDFIDEVGEKYTIYTVVHPNLKNWVLTNKLEDVKSPLVKTIIPHATIEGNLEWYIDNNWTIKEWEFAFKHSPYYGSTAPEIDWKQRVKIQGVIQKYITHSISSTVNLDTKVTEEEIADIYIESWKHKLKGITIYRDGCRDGVLTKIEKPKEIEGREAPKRPKELEADAYLVKVKGEQFIILIGLLEGKPYEVFTFRPLNKIDFKPHKGVITKIKKMHYSFHSDHLHIDNLGVANSNVEENAATLYSSMLLRHGVNPEYIIKTAKKVNDNITSFSSAMCRIISKYIGKTEIKGEVCPDCEGTLVRENGCLHCIDCGYSKCL